MTQCKKPSFLGTLFLKYVERPYRQQHINLLRREIVGQCDTLLDIGCGDGSHMQTIAPTLKYSVGIDLFAPALESARKKSIYSDAICMDARRITQQFGEKKFDCVVAFDLIEHLTKDDGLRLLKSMEKIAIKKIIVFTPNSFVPQGSIDDNEYQIHVSGWSTDELRSFGYKVIGVHGLKWLLGKKSKPRWKPAVFWKTVTVLTQPMCRVFPSIAFQLFCIKGLGHGQG